MRWLPLAAVVVYIAGFLGLRVLVHRRRFGGSPIHIPAANDVSAHAFLSRMLVAFFAALLALSLLEALAPDLLDRVDPLHAAHSASLALGGALVMAAGGFLIWRAQDDMAASWRVGIDAAERTQLVTGGLFRFCRNPIYLGLQLGLAGFCLLVPGYLSLMLFVVAAMLFQVQARLEEAYLLGLHGEDYARYCRTTGRFLPWSGRWP